MPGTTACSEILVASALQLVVAEVVIVVASVLLGVWVAELSNCGLAARTGDATNEACGAVLTGEVNAGDVAAAIGVEQGVVGAAATASAVGGQTGVGGGGCVEGGGGVGPPTADGDHGGDAAVAGAVRAGGHGNGCFASAPGSAAPVMIRNVARASAGGCEIGLSRASVIASANSMRN